MQQITDIKLIVIDEKPDSAEAIGRILRDASLIVPINWVNNALRLQQTIEAEEGLIAIANANLPWLPLEHICQLCNEHNMVTLALGEVPNPSLELRALRQGALSLVHPNHAGLLEQRVLQAISQTRMHAAKGQQDKQLTDLTDRCDALLDTSKEPVAYTIEGVITSANNAFALAVGAENSVQVVGRLVSDFIGPESLYQFSRQLRTLIRGDSKHVQMDNTAICTLQGTVTSAHLFMDNIQVNDEHSTQILLRDCKTNHAKAPLNSPQRPEASQMLNLMDTPLGKQLKGQLQTDNKPAPALALVPSNQADVTSSQTALKAALEHSAINSMMARLSAWDAQEATQRSNHGTSANDQTSVAPLQTLLEEGKASLCTQPLLGLHADEPMLLARVQAGNTLMPVAQMLEDLGGENSVDWLLKQLDKMAEGAQLVLGPVSKTAVNASSIERIQTIKNASNLVLGMSEHTLSSDYHGSSQFLLQLQKLNMKTALWMNSTPSVLSGLLNDLATSVRSGINTIVLKAVETPVIQNDEIQSQEWATLIHICQQNNIQLVAPRPHSTEQLQTWWRLGIGWCLAGENAAISQLKHTGTTHS